MRALGAVGDAARLDHVAEQAEIGEIEAHEKAAFVFDEVWLCRMPIALGHFNANLSHETK